jgi:hypothetical protein
MNSSRLVDEVDDRCRSDLELSDILNTNTIELGFTKGMR